MSKNSDRSIDWHRRYGKFRVIYPDGGISIPFTKDVAKEYAAIFGGKLIKKDGVFSDRFQIIGNIFLNKTNA